MARSVLWAGLRRDGRDPGVGMTGGQAHLRTGEQESQEKGHGIGDLTESIHSTTHVS